ncbi:hypothetical protein BDP55DRAFT_640647 [Colletotrichum godetiae]|uniref:Uncharacterized protein n=1 Tax=Colletotrichum godetiae TaxID=1209918 RepID=A0AAJ0B200_9PEZI|nr:uncharacterized protein BDP55DRAFT_640647 [Colletotrichum godetiae]KAK1701151.1 hypothetical protein BDP55DRAFT_640647 [Colletotrichum godetiae]
MPRRLSKQPTGHLLWAYASFATYKCCHSLILPTFLMQRRIRWSISGLHFHIFGQEGRRIQVYDTTVCRSTKSTLAVFQLLLRTLLPIMLPVLLSLLRLLSISNSFSSEYT